MKTKLLLTALLFLLAASCAPKTGYVDNIANKNTKPVGYHAK